MNAKYSEFNQFLGFRCFFFVSTFRFLSICERMQFLNFHTHTQSIWFWLMAFVSHSEFTFLLFHCAFASQLANSVNNICRDLDYHIFRTVLIWLDFYTSSVMFSLHLYIFGHFHSHQPISAFWMHIIACIECEMSEFEQNVCCIHAFENGLVEKVFVRI